MEYYFWLALSFQAGREQVVWRMKRGLRPHRTELKLRSRQEAEAALWRLNQMGGRVVTYSSEEYPERLRHIPQPPAILYCVGPLRLHQVPAVAMVGPRKPSRYGLRMAADLGRDLAAAGVTIISGLALGIDSAAHRAALAAGGKTIAVLGCGVDVPYPPRERQLYQEIARRGLLVSEYPPGMPALKHHFPERNRLISGLSNAVVVVEATLKSGSLITAAHAADQNRDLLAVPGQVGSALAEGPLRLIQEGAGLVRTAQDVLDALHLVIHAESTGDGAAEQLPPVGASLPDGSGRSDRSDRPEPSDPSEPADPPEPPELLEPDLQLLLQRLAWGPADPELLMEATGLPMPRVLAILSTLELHGLVTRLPDGSVHRNSRSGGG